MISGHQSRIHEIAYKLRHGDMTIESISEYDRPLVQLVFLEQWLANRAISKSKGYLKKSPSCLESK